MLQRVAGSPEVELQGFEAEKSPGSGVIPRLIRTFRVLELEGIRQAADEDRKEIDPRIDVFPGRHPPDIPLRPALAERYGDFGDLDGIMQLDIIGTTATVLRHGNIV